VSGIESVILL